MEGTHRIINNLELEEMLREEDQVTTFLLSATKIRCHLAGFGCKLLVFQQVGRPLVVRVGTETKERKCKNQNRGGVVKYLIGKLA